MRSARALAVAIALCAGSAEAQGEPTPTWDPRAGAAEARPASDGAKDEPAPSTATATPTATPTPTSTATATPTPTAIPTPIPTAIPTPTATPTPISPPAIGDPEAPLRPAGVAPVDRRWSLAAHFGGAATGAPQFLVAAGVVVGAVAGVRLDLSLSLGWSAEWRDVPVQPAWNDEFDTYTSARASERAFLVELTASRRVGAFELWGGGGLHLSTPQFEATYEYTQCNDFPFCQSRERVSDTDAKMGSGAVGPLLAAGARVAVSERVLMGLALRWLAPATSQVADRYGVSIPTGGLSVTAGVVVRLGAPVALR